MKIHPSSLNQLKHCTGFVSIAAALPRSPKSNAATEGDEAHATLESTLRNGTTTDNSMIQSVADYIIEKSNGSPLYLEHSVELNHIHTGMKGTVDVAWYDEQRRTLVVLDLKYGRTEVPAENNWQLASYASYFLALHRPVSVVFIIAQPKSDEPFKVVTYTPTDVDVMITDIRSAIAVAICTSPTCTTGQHCRYCNSLWACSAASQYIIEGMSAMYAPNVEDVSYLAAKLSLFRELKSLSKKKVDQLEAIINAKLDSGERVADIQVRYKKGKLQWAMPIESVISLLPAECIKHTPMTPTQIINGKLAPSDFIETITRRGNSKSLDVLTQEDYKCLLQ